MQKCLHSESQMSKSLTIYTSPKAAVTTVALSKSMQAHTHICTHKQYAKLTIGHCNHSDESPFLKEISAPRRESHCLCFDLITAHTSPLTPQSREERALIQMPCGTLDPFLPVASFTPFSKPFCLLLSLFIPPHLCRVAAQGYTIQPHM